MTDGNIVVSQWRPGEKAFIHCKPCLVEPSVGSLFICQELWGASETPQDQREQKSKPGPLMLIDTTRILAEFTEADPKAYRTGGRPLLERVFPYQETHAVLNQLCDLY